MNPKKVLLFIVSVLLSLLMLTFVSGQYAYAETDEYGYDKGYQYGFKLGDLLIKFPTFGKLTQVRKDVKNDKAQEILNSEAQILAKQQQDSLEAEKNKIIPFVSNEEGKIYYPDNPEEFVAKLHEKLSQPTCRIIHYGASKIEGDRITSYIRNELQEIYGGSGTGYFPIKMPYNQKSIEITTSENWFRYALFNADQRKNKDLLPNNQYGLYANVCRFTSAKETDTTSIKKAFFVIKPSYKHYARLHQYTQMGIHYGNCKTPTAISVYQNGHLLRNDSLKTDGKYHHYKLQFEKTPAEIRVELSGRVSPDFYAITLDSKQGIKMDNVPTRGDSGFHFSRLQNTFEQMCKELKPEIFFFEFGGNLVPSLKNEEQVRSNVRRIIANIEWVKRRNPNALYLLIGPSDMLRKDVMESYEILPTLVAEMKKQALEKGIAFWSMYEAMGGANSMKTWFDNGYSSTDYIHFSEKGTEKISELLFKEISENLKAVQQIQQARKAEEERQKELRRKEVQQALETLKEVKEKQEIPQ